MSDLIYKLDKTSEDIDALLQEHKNLVYYILTKTGQLRNQDAESAAWEALWDAINLFDVYAKTAFSTFACTLIKNAVNNILRKQIFDRQHLCAFSYLAESTEIVYIAEPDDSAALIEKYFKEYVDAKTGKLRNVLLAWYASGFTLNGTALAKMCNTSPSYVSRIQCSLRAYLSGKLKNQ